MVDGVISSSHVGKVIIKNPLFRLVCKPSSGYTLKNLAQLCMKSADMATISTVLKLLITALYITACTFCIRTSNTQFGVRSGYIRPYRVSSNRSEPALLNSTTNNYARNYARKQRLHDSMLTVCF